MNLLFFDVFSVFFLNLTLIGLDYKPICHGRIILKERGPKYKLHKEQVALKTLGKIFNVAPILYKLQIIGPFSFQNQKEKSIFVSNFIFLIFQPRCEKCERKSLESGVTKIKHFVRIDLGHQKVEIHVELFILMRGARIIKKIYLILIRFLVSGFRIVFWGYERVYRVAYDIFQVFWVKEICKKFDFWAEQTISTIFLAIVVVENLANTNDASSYIFLKKNQGGQYAKTKKKNGPGQASPDGMGQAGWHGLLGPVALPFLFFFSKFFFSFF